MSEPLIPDYRPAEPHGWPPAGPGQRVGMTLGGNPRSRTFARGGRNYRIDLLTPHPVYRHRPADREIAFERTLADAFGATFAFQYVGGLAGRGVLRARSYGVTVVDPAEGQPLMYGGDVYVVYQPDGRAAEPRADQMLRWIQVARTAGTADAGKSFLDNGRRANPYYVHSGRTSAAGSPVINFYHCLISPVLDDGPIRAERFVAESFLVRDTRTRDAEGKAIVEVYGGIYHGWQLQEVSA